MPPVGHGTHHYEFTLHALDEEQDLDSGLSRDDIFERIKGHIIATAKLIGIYERTAKAAGGEKKKSA